MSDRFKVIGIDQKNGYWIQFKNPYDSTDLAHHYYMNETEDEMTEIDKWVLQHDLGRRQGFAIWQLNDEKAMSMFLLKWG